MRFQFFASVVRQIETASSQSRNDKEQRETLVCDISRYSLFQEGIKKIFPLN